MFYARWRKGLAKPATWPFPAMPQPHLFPPGSRPVEVLRPCPPCSLTRSLAIRHIDVGSCGGPESEISLLSTPRYDISRFGFVFTPSPRHADVLLVTGSPTDVMMPLLRETYEAMPAPRRVVVAGACANADCPVASGAGVSEALRRAVPVDVFVPGCPPCPAALIAGLFAAVGRSAPGLAGHVVAAMSAGGDGGCDG